VSPVGNAIGSNDGKERSSNSSICNLTILGVRFLEEYFLEAGLRSMIILEIRDY
jgi:hypothetical protein